MHRVLLRIGIFILGGFLILSWSGRTALAHDSIKAFKASMEVSMESNVSVAQIWARKGVLRMSVPSRVSSGMIARYDDGKAWALIPSAARYQVFPIESLGDAVPHFFDPSLTIHKEKVGSETVAGKDALKYEVKIERLGKTPYQGYLWEAKELPGYPLKWQDATREVVALWKNAGLIDVPKGFFNLPEGYTEQKAASDRVRKNEMPCKKSRKPAESEVN